MLTKLKKHICVIFWLLLAGAIVTVQAQVDKKECLEAVRSIYQKFQVMPQSDQIYYVKYSMNTVMRRPAKNASQMTVEMIMNTQKMVYLSKEVEVYQNKEVSFMVLPAQKMLYVNSSAATEKPQDQLQMFTAFQDSLLSACTVGQCKKLTGKTSGSDRMVELILPEAITARNGLKRIVFYLNTQTRHINKMDIYYGASHQIEHVEINIHTIDKNYQTNKLEGEITSRFYTSGNTLQPAYRGYKVIDLRSSNGK